MLDSVGPGQILLADRAYDSDALREALATRRAKANIKPMPNRVNVPKFNKKTLPKENFCRALLQQAQALPFYRHTLRKARCQITCRSLSSPQHEFGCDL